MQILFEDKNILVINKPAGMAVHKDGKSDKYTIADWLIEQVPEVFGVGETIDSNGHIIEKWGIVHRLDRDTSGVMLLVKNAESFEHFKKQFQDRKVKKIYNTFVYGWPKEEKNIIESDISRQKGSVMKWTANPKSLREKSKVAITEYKVLKFYSMVGREHEEKGSTELDDFAFIEVSPKTGRTHQIRVHMKYINHPIVCDPIYSRNIPALGFERLALHARSLELPGMDGKTIKFEAPYPEDFLNAIRVIS